MADVGRVLRLLQFDEDPFGVGGCQVWIGDRHLELGELPPPVPVGVVDEEPPVGRIIGVEGQAEETLLDPVGEDPIRDVEKGAP